jgi:diaminopimelate epimerase
MPELTLTKHHALGNDFLVCLDLDGRHLELTEELARAVCDRHRGIGADGVILGWWAGADGEVVMQLRNADGSPAETSGNGIRCLAQAVADTGRCPDSELRVLTDAGPRDVAVGPETEPGLRQITVDMGPARVEQLPDGPGRRSAHVDIGNPHLVVLDDGALDLAALGRSHPDRNVEVVSGAGDELTIEVWERGVGPTEACGTGSCAAAAAASSWGLVGTSVVVHNPGGDVTVDLQAATVLLTGPTQYVGRVEVPWGWLERAWR